MNDLYDIINSDFYMRKDTGYNYKILSEEELNQLESICKRWLIPIKKTDQSKDETFLKIIDNLYDNYLKELDFGPAIRAYLKRIRQIPIKFTQSEEISGSVVMFGCIFMSLQNFGYIKELDGAFLFGLSYILIDHMLDDISVSKKDKLRNIIEIYKFMKGEDVDIQNNQILSVTSEKYKQLIQRVPDCKHYFKKLFEGEIKGFIIQENPNLSRETYHKIAIEKGGLTGSAMGSILGLEEQYNYDLAAVLQLVDDLDDISIDIDENIYTLARYDWDNKNLDEYIYETITRIDQLPSIYNFFKIVLMLLVMLGIHDHLDGISERLYNKINLYIPYDKETNKEKLTQWFTEKVYDYIYDVLPSLKHGVSYSTEVNQSSE